MKNVLVLGAGQLARMMALSGIPLNIKLHAFEIATHTVIEPITRYPLDISLADAIQNADVITAEFEHIPAETLQLCALSGKLFPNETAISVGGNRSKEKALLEKIDVDNAPHRHLHSKDDLIAAARSLSLPLIIKTTHDGYDGKGQWRLETVDEIPALWEIFANILSSNKQQQGLLAEACIAFDREVSLIGARNAKGQVTVYPLTENIHHEGMLSVSLCTEQKVEKQQQAEAIFNKIVNELDYVGVLAVEFFDLDGVLFVNEIAPRVHNSGHWTQQGCAVSQFEQHLRAICGLPLGNTERLHPSAMLNIIGYANTPHAFMQYGHFHLYDKTARPKRKMGHINVIGHDTANLHQKLASIHALTTENTFPGLAKALEKIKPF